MTRSLFITHYERAVRAQRQHDGDVQSLGRELDALRARVQADERALHEARAAIDLVPCMCTGHDEGAYVCTRHLAARVIDDAIGGAR